MQRDAGSNPAGASPAAPPVFVTSRQRDPPVFAGLRGEDVEDWLDIYNRVSAFNRWDDLSKLQSVEFYLADPAKRWFKNREDRIADWASFSQQLREMFGTPTIRADVAKRQLSTRIQRPEETYASYIEDVLALCRRVDESMPEADKVRHVLKGIASFAYNALVVQNPSSVDDVRTTCQRLDELQSIRLQQDARALQLHGELDLRAIIRQIIREELHLHDPPAPTRDHVCTQPPQLRDIVKEELASMTGLLPATSSVTATPTLSYSAIASRPPPPLEAPLAHGHLTAISAANTPRGYYSNVRPVRQVFSSDRPVCYYCGIRGHISRFCRRRQQDERRGYAPFERDIGFPYGPRNNGYASPPRRPSPPPASLNTTHQNRSSRRRSLSPYRRSVSPLRPASHVVDNRSEN